eukprot:750287-Hanusia_phi.AAC.1
MPGSVGWPRNLRSDLKKPPPLIYPGRGRKGEGEIVLTLHEAVKLASRTGERGSEKDTAGDRELGRRRQGRRRQGRRRRKKRRRKKR